MKGKVVVLGGGVSGLSAAWNICTASKNGLAPTVQVLEASKDRFGGWLHSERITMNGRSKDTNSSKSSFLFESGPRTIRPVGDAAIATLLMVHRLGLAEKTITVSKSSDAAKNRYIYYKNQLNKLPTSLWDQLFKTPPVTEGLLPSIFKEPFIRRKSDYNEDESIHSFISRRLGKNVAENMISAMAHGIFAGDIKKLSIRSCFEILWEAEKKHGSITRGMLAPKSGVSPYVTALMNESNITPVEKDFIRKIMGASVYTFQGGIETLINTLVDELQTKYAQQTSLSLNEPVAKLNIMHNCVEVTTASGMEITADHVVSALPAHAIAPLLPQVPSLATIPFVTVGVINLAFSTSPSATLPVSGFGYLVPSPSPVLGVIFDSITVSAHDVSFDGDITRLTVMVGGHGFEKYFGDVNSKNLEGKVLDAALKAVKEHLGISEDPIASRVHIHQNCLAQYEVGHYERLKRIRNELSENCPGMISLCGNSYLGVGVNDAIRSGRDVGVALANGDFKITGLERVK